MRLCFIVFSVLLLIMTFATSWALNERNRMHQGSSQGFNLNGSYTKVTIEESLLSFGESPQEGEGIFWWASDKNSVDHGSVKSTHDPNCYILEDDNGVEVGLVHLAYTSGNKEGILFVRFGSGDFIEMHKINNHITFRN